MHLVEEPGRTVEGDGLFSADEETEEPVEAEEVVEMGVRDKHLVDAEDPAHRQGGDVAEVEQDGAPLEQRLDEHRRIAETAVDEHGMKEWPHFVFARKPF